MTSPPLPDKTCQFCRDLDYDALLSSSGYFHHPNWASVIHSADLGCRVCDLAVSLARGRHEDESTYWWKKEERDEHVVCSLSGDVIYWKYGTIQRSMTSVCVDYHDPLAGLIPARPVHDSILDESCIAMMKEWLRRCATEHDACVRDDTHRLPTRVLDVGSDSKPPRLVVSKGRYGEWVALSHCWGQKMPIRTESASFKSHCEEIPITLLGRTFEDAVLITRALGIQYLWIDTLCIIQDSDSDWRAESVTMNYVYQNAIFTIAAEASSGSEIGIRGSTKDSRLPGSTLPSAICHSATKSVKGRLLFRANEEVWSSRGPLSARAWTMQEENLSPRIIRFSQQQILWRCDSDWKSREWHPNGTAKPIFPDFVQSLRERVRKFPEQEPDYEFLASDSMKASLMSFWHTQVVNYYAVRNITFPSDKLVAVSGIVNEMQRYLPDSDYEQGLWVEDIHTSLAWAAPESGTTAYREYVAPSWSWAHLDFSATVKDHLLVYEGILLNNLTPLADITGFEDKVVSAIDSIERRALNLRAQACIVCSCHVPEAFIDQRKSSALDYHYQLGQVSGPQNQFVNSIGLSKIAEDQCDKHQPYLYILLARWDQSDGFHVPVLISLILEEFGNKLDPVYRRVGRAFIPVGIFEQAEWPVWSVTII